MSLTLASSSYEAQLQTSQPKLPESGLVVRLLPLFEDAVHSRTQAKAQAAAFVLDLTTAFRSAGVVNLQSLQTANYEKVFAYLSPNSQQQFVDIISNNYHLSQESVRIGFRRECVLLTANEREAYRLMQAKCKNETVTPPNPTFFARVLDPLKQAYTEVCNNSAVDAERALKTDDANRAAASSILHQLFTKPITLKRANEHRIPGLAPVIRTYSL